MPIETSELQKEGTLDRDAASHALEQDQDEDEPAFRRLQRRGLDTAERGTGMGIRGGKYPVWLKFAILVVVMLISGGQKVYWLKDKDEEQGAFARMKKKLVGFAIVAIVMLFLACGGLFFVLFTMTRGGFGRRAMLSSWSAGGTGRSRRCFTYVVGTSPTTDQCTGWK